MDVQKLKGSKATAEELEGMTPFQKRICEGANVVATIDNATFIALFGEDTGIKAPTGSSIYMWKEVRFIHKDQLLVVESERAIMAFFEVIENVIEITEHNWSPLSNASAARIILKDMTKS